MRKKRWLLVVVGLMLLLSMLSACQAKEVGPIVLKVGYIFPPDYFAVTNLIDPMLKGIEERTEGRIQFEVYPAQQLYKGADLLEAVGGGVVDLAPYAIVGYVAGKVPLQTVSLLPLGLGDTEVLLAFDQLPEVVEIKGAELLKYNIKYVSQDGASGPQHIWNNVRPIKTLEDLNGLKIRAGGGIPGPVLTSFGAVPVEITAPELYMAYQRGTIDGGYSGLSTWQGRDCMELTKYVTMVYMDNMAAPTLCNLDTWNSLSKDSQKKIKESCDDARAQFIAYMSSSEAAILEEAKEKFGIEVYYLPADEKARWLEAASHVVDDWVEENGEDGRRLVELARDFVKKQGK